MMRRKPFYTYWALVMLFSLLGNVAALERGFCKFKAFNTTLGISGTVVFDQFTTNSTTMVNVTVRVTSQLPDAQYAIHVHEFGDISSALASGGHFIGNGVATHACPPLNMRHEGDTSNWASTSGVIFQVKTLDLLDLTDTDSIIGRSVILHSGQDDCVTQPTGNAGARNAGCVIGIADLDQNTATNMMPNVQQAICVMESTPNCIVPNSCNGTLWFVQQNGITNITGTFSGLLNNTMHGLQIHTFGEWTSFSLPWAAGGHYNPFGRPHGLPPYQPRHVGDLGNINSFDSKDIAWYNYSDSSFPPLASLLGRGVAVTVIGDHGSGLGCIEGSAGDALMTCVIGIANSTIPPPIPPIPIVMYLQNTTCFAPGSHHDTGLVVAVAFGWVLAAVLLAILLGFLFLYYRSRSYQVVSYAD